METGRVTGGTMYAPAESERVERTLPAESEQERTLPDKDIACTLHISEEGFQRLEQSEEMPQEMAEDALVMPGGDEEPADRAARIQQFVDARKDVFSHLEPKPSLAINKEKAGALEELRQMEQDQEEKYRRMEAEAQTIARKRTKSRNTVEKGMRELTIMLESVKPQEKDEKDEKEASRANKSGGERERTFLQKEEQPTEVLLENADGEPADARDTMQAVGHVVAGLGFRRELGLDVTVSRIYENARADFAYARDKDEVLRSQLASLYHTLEQDEVSEEEKDAATAEFLKYGQVALSDIKDFMGYGLERLKNIRTLHVGRHANQNMVYASRAQEDINRQAGQTMLGDLYLDGFEELEEKSFEELAEQIRKLQEAERPSEVEDAKREEETEEIKETKEEEERGEVSEQESEAKPESEPAAEESR